MSMAVDRSCPAMCECPDLVSAEGEERGENDRSARFVRLVAVANSSEEGNQDEQRVGHNEDLAEGPGRAMLAHGHPGDQAVVGCHLGR